MDHPVRENVLNSPLDSTSEEELRQSFSSDPTTDVERSPLQSIDFERPLPQPFMVNQNFGSNGPTIRNSLVPSFVNHNNEIESLVSSFSARNSTSSETLLQDTGLESPQHHYSFGVDLDFPILTGEPLVEVDF